MPRALGQLPCLLLEPAARFGGLPVHFGRQALLLAGAARLLVGVAARLARAPFRFRRRCASSSLEPCGTSHAGHADTLYSRGHPAEGAWSYSGRVCPVPPSSAGKSFIL